MGLFATEKQKLQRRLRRASETGDVEILEAAIAAGADIEDCGDGKTDTPLARALDQSSFRCAKILLLKGANPNTKTESGRTCLTEAAAYADSETVALLIEKGAKIDACGGDGRTALHEAAARGRGEIVKILLEKGADTEAPDNRMNTPADAAQTHYPRVAELIRKHGAKKQPPVPETTVIEGWQLTAPDEVSNITEKTGIGYRLTEIFNFGSGIYTRIAHNMQTGAESQSLRFFDEFTDPAALNRAREALTRLGGEAAGGAIRKLDKPSLPARPQGSTP